MERSGIVSDAKQIKAGLEKLLKYIEESTRQEPQDDTRRQQWRYSWPAPATVKLADASEPAESSDILYITLHNISAENVDFYSPRELEIDSKVTIILETEDGQLCVPGTVLHSISSVSKPLVAVRFELDE